MQLTDLTWTQAQALPREIPVVFPVAALEQHGHHLPVFTDSFLLGEIARRAEAKLGNRALFAPLQWLGNSEHHLDFAGTMSATPRAYLDLLNGMLENFLHHGFRRLVFINGHGGNDVPGRQVIFEARQRHRHRSDLLLLLFATYWQLGATPPLAAAALQQVQMGHACEWETSMMLRIAPHLVRDFKLAKPVSAGNLFEPVARGWTTKDRSAQGHIGLPHLASAEKGEALLSFFSAEVVQLIERVVAWNGKDW